MAQIGHPDEEEKPIYASLGPNQQLESITFEEVMEFSDSLRKFLARYPKVKTHVQALHGSVRSVSRHAGGVVIGEDLDYHMPLINSGGVTQTPWSEGQTVRHLEPMGFIKFDILGLSTIEMIEQAIVNILKRQHNNNNYWVSLGEEAKKCALNHALSQPKLMVSATLSTPNFKASNRSTPRATPAHSGRP